jgi:1-acyl-sn-glycerol-3-phosphate acyltransferase
MITIRSLAFHAAFYLMTTLLAIVGLPVLAGDRLKVQAYARFWTRTSIWLLEKICGTRIEFRGLGHIPNGACLIAAKHQSALETLALTTITKDFSYILKKELMGIPIFGWYLARAGQIALDRSKRGQALPDLSRQAREAIEDGRQIFIFPEGTRRGVGAAPEYKSGVAHLYTDARALCVPVALNTGLFWPRQSILLRPGTAVIEFLEPIAPGMSKQEFLRLLQSRIEEATEALAAEALATDPNLKRSSQRMPAAT